MIEADYNAESPHCQRTRPQRKLETPTPSGSWRLRKSRGNGARCVLVCVYENRAYEDTLVEMEDAAKECGFQVTAAIAAIAEHSITPQYATNKPKEEDRKQLIDFADPIAEKTTPESAIPGHRPYKTVGGAGLVPMPDKSCVKCGMWAKVCSV